MSHLEHEQIIQKDVGEDDNCTIEANRSDIRKEFVIGRLDRRIIPEWKTKAM